MEAVSSEASSRQCSHPTTIERLHRLRRPRPARRTDASLRTPDGWRDLVPGETVAFPVGERGAHQLVNQTDETSTVAVRRARSTTARSGSRTPGPSAASRNGA
jgi:hypothetical protein